MVANRSEEAEDFLTVPEAAAAMRVSGSTMWRWIRDKRVPSFRTGRRVLVRRQDLGSLIVQYIPIRRVRTPSVSLTAYMRPMSQDAVDWQTAMKEAAALKERILARTGGRLLPDSTPDIIQARNER